MFILLQEAFSRRKHIAPHRAYSEDVESAELELVKNLELVGCVDGKEFCVCYDRMHKLFYKSNKSYSNRFTISEEFTEEDVLLSMMHRRGKEKQSQYKEMQLKIKRSKKRKLVREKGAVRKAIISTVVVTGDARIDDRHIINFCDVSNTKKAP